MTSKEFSNNNSGWFKSSYERATIIILFAICITLTFIIVEEDVRFEKAISILTEIENKNDKNDIHLCQDISGCTYNNGTNWRIVSNAESDVFFAIFFPSRIDKIIKRNTTWKHHESDRSKSIHKALEQFLTGELVTSNDHRIVIGIALLAYLLDEKVQFLNYTATWKSFPTFFNMLELIKQKLREVEK